MAEWLGEGLQNLLRRFDSVWYLKKNTDSKELVFFIFTKSKFCYRNVAEGLLCVILKKTQYLFPSCLESPLARNV